MGSDGGLVSPPAGLALVLPLHALRQAEQERGGQAEPDLVQESGAAFGRTCPKTLNVNVKICTQPHKIPAASVLDSYKVPSPT